MLLMQKPACSNSACKYSLPWGVGAVSIRVFRNLMPAVCNSRQPPALPSIPTRKRNRTGSPKRSRRVERASDTGPCPQPGGSHAMVNSCTQTLGSATDTSRSIQTCTCANSKQKDASSCRQRSVLCHGVQSVPLGHFQGFPQHIYFKMKTANVLLIT